jgi:hypothetical protein
MSVRLLSKKDTLSRIDKAKASNTLRNIYLKRFGEDSSSMYLMEGVEIYKESKDAETGTTFIHPIKDLAVARVSSRILNWVEWFQLPSPYLNVAYYRFKITITNNSEYDYPLDDDNQD